MLVITRKRQERFSIGHDIEVTVLKIQGNRVKLGIQGPADVPIRRHQRQATVANGSPDAGSAAPLPRCPVDENEVPDRELELRVKGFLERLNLAALRDLDVEIRNGAAVITGRVRTFYQKQLATSCFQRVAGVLNVLNKVRLTDAPGGQG